MERFGVGSEVGRLRSVLLHEPDLELTRLSPSNVHELLFDEIMWVERAQLEHRAFAQVLRERGVEVLLLGDLLAEALAVEAARKELLDRVVTIDAFGQGLVPDVREWFDSLPDRELARYLVGGVIPEDLPFPPQGLVGASFQPTTFVLPPLPNQIFMRDTSAWMYGGVSINPMAFPARRRETLHLEAVYRHHPVFASAEFPVWYGGDGLDHYPAVVEGGDLLVIGNRVLLVGMGERTSPQGVEALARRMFEAGALDSVIAVELPKMRAYMHLDTVLTQVDRDAFVVFPGLRQRMRPFVVTRAAAGTSRSRPRTSCSPRSPASWTFPASGPSRPAATSCSPRASSGTTATTCWRSSPAWWWPTSATWTPTSGSATTGSRSSPSPASSWAGAAAVPAA